MIFFVISVREEKVVNVKTNSPERPDEEKAGRGQGHATKDEGGVNGNICEYM